MKIRAPRSAPASHHACTAACPHCNAAPLPQHKTGIKYAFDSVEELCACPEVHIVSVTSPTYVAVPLAAVCAREAPLLVSPHWWSTEGVAVVVASALRFLCAFFAPSDVMVVPLYLSPALCTNWRPPKREGAALDSPFLWFARVRRAAF